MEYVNLGSTGLKVSRICLGTMTYGSKKWREWVLEEEESRPFIRRALEPGINFFDTADMYSLGVSEEITGRALKEFGPSRDKVVIATKVFNPMGDDPNQRGLSRKHIMHAIDDSLRRLQTDYVDLYQIHRFDPHTPIEETMEALDEVVRSGKALYIGASSMYRLAIREDAPRPQMKMGLPAIRHHAEPLQPDLPRRRTGDDSTLPRARDRAHSVESAGARLSGRKPEQAGTRRNGPFKNRRLCAQALLSAVGFHRSGASHRDRKKPRRLNAQIALAWILGSLELAHPIIGASKMPHLEKRSRRSIST